MAYLIQLDRHFRYFCHIYLPIVSLLVFCISWGKKDNHGKTYHIWTSVSKERFHSDVFFNGKLYRLLLLITKHACTTLKYTVVYSIRLLCIKIFDLTKDFGSHLHAVAQAAESAVASPIALHSVSPKNIPSTSPQKESKYSGTCYINVYMTSKFTYSHILTCMLVEKNEN